MPVLVYIAATIFVMQASSAGSERHYSAFNARPIITPIRNRLCPDIVEAVSINLESYKNSLLWIKFSEFWLFSSNLLGPGSGFIWVTRIQGQQKWPSFISGPNIDCFTWGIIIHISSDKKCVSRFYFTSSMLKQGKINFNLRKKVYLLRILAFRNFFVVSVQWNIYNWGFSSKNSHEFAFSRFFFQIYWSKSHI